MRLKSKKIINLKPSQLEKLGNQIINLENDQNLDSQRIIPLTESYQRKSFYSKKKSHIPTLKQAKQRQKQVIYFHNRTFYRKQRYFEQIFKQNCRIYQQLQKQKSHYQESFTKNRKLNYVSCSQYKSVKISQIQKKIKNRSFDSKTSEIQRIFSYSNCKGEKDLQKSIRQKNQINILNSFQQNKGQIIHKRCRTNNKENFNQQVRKEKNSNFGSFAQNKINQKQENNDNEKPNIFKFKRRPKSGFRS